MKDYKKIFICFLTLFVFLNVPVEAKDFVFTWLIKDSKDGKYYAKYVTGSFNGKWIVKDARKGGTPTYFLNGKYKYQFFRRIDNAFVTIADNFMLVSSDDSLNINDLFSPNAAANAAAFLKENSVDATDKKNIVILLNNFFCRSVCVADICWKQSYKCEVLSGIEEFLFNTGGSLYQWINPYFIFITLAEKECIERFVKDSQDSQDRQVGRWEPIGAEGYNALHWDPVGTEGYNALHIAARFRESDIIEALLKNCPEKLRRETVERKTMSGRSFLSIIKERKDEKMLSSVVRSYPDIQDLYISAKGVDAIETLKALISEESGGVGVARRFPADYWMKEQNALHIAAEAKLPELMCRVLCILPNEKMKVMSEAKDKYGKTPFQLLMNQRFTDVDAERSLSLLHELNSEDVSNEIKHVHRMVVLKYAFSENKSDIIKSVASICQPDEWLRCMTQQDNLGLTLIHFAAGNGFEKIIREAVGYLEDENQRYAAISFPSADGKTALHFAITHGIQNVFCMLLELCPDRYLYDYLMKKKARSIKKPMSLILCRAELKRNIAVKVFEILAGKNDCSAVSRKAAIDSSFWLTPMEKSPYSSLPLIHHIASLGDANLLMLCIKSCPSELWERVFKLTDFEQKTVFHHAAISQPFKGVQYLFDTAKEVVSLDSIMAANDKFGNSVMQLWKKRNDDSTEKLKSDNQKTEKYFKGLTGDCAHSGSLVVTKKPCKSYGSYSHYLVAWYVEKDQKPYAFYYTGSISKPELSPDHVEKFTMLDIGSRAFLTEQCFGVVEVPDCAHEKPLMPKRVVVMLSKNPIYRSMLIDTPDASSLESDYQGIDCVKEVLSIFSENDCFNEDAFDRKNAFEVPCEDAPCHKYITEIKTVGQWFHPVSVLLLTADSSVFNTLSSTGTISKMKWKPFGCYSMTPLHIVARGRDFEFLNALFHSCPESEISHITGCKSEPENRTFLNDLASLGKANVFCSFIEGHLSFCNEALDVEWDKGDKILHVAARAGNASFIKKVFEHFNRISVSPSEYFEYKNKRQETILHAAACSGNFEAICEILSACSCSDRRQILLESVDCQSRKAVNRMISHSSGSAEKAKAIIEKAKTYHGEARDDIETMAFVIAIFYSVNADDHEMINKIRNMCTEENWCKYLSQLDGNGYSPLHHAVGKGSLLLVKAMLGSIEQDQRRYSILKLQSVHVASTPLHIAARRFQDKDFIFEYLLKQCPVEKSISYLAITDKHGEHACHAMASERTYQQTKMIKLLELIGGIYQHHPDKSKVEADEAFKSIWLGKGKSGNTLLKMLEDTGDSGVLNKYKEICPALFLPDHSGVTP